MIVIDHLARSARYREFDAALLDETRALTALVEQTGDQIESDLGRGAATLPYFELWTDSAAIGRALARARRHAPRGEPAPRSHVVEIQLPGGAARQATVAFDPRQDEDEGPRAAPKHYVLAVARADRGRRGVARDARVRC